MELGVKDVSVQGVDFQFTLLTATEARKVHTMLARALGPALGALGLHGLNEGAVGKAFGEVLSGLNDEDMKQLHDKLMRNSKVRIDGTFVRVESVYDLYFAGKPMLLWAWCFEGLKVNFSDFLEGDLQSKLAQIVAKMSPSESPTT